MTAPLLPRTGPVPSQGSPSDDSGTVTPARIDTRPRARRMLAPLLVAGGSVAALGYLWAVDPNQPGHYPLCPLKALFGIDCPGCGMLRGTHDLLHGEVGRALDHNVLLAVLVPAAVIGWVVWAWRSWTGRHPQVTARQVHVRNGVMIAATIVLVTFGVVRNFMPYLGSGIG